MLISTVETTVLRAADFGINITCLAYAPNRIPGKVRDLYPNVDRLIAKEYERTYAILRRYFLSTSKDQFTFPRVSVRPSGIFEKGIPHRDGLNCEEFVFKCGIANYRRLPFGPTRSRARQPAQTRSNQ